MADQPGFPFSSLQGAVNLKKEGQEELYRQIMLVYSNDKSEEKTITRTRVESIIEAIREKQEYQKNPKVEEKRKKNKKKIEEKSASVDNLIEGIIPLQESLKVYDNKADANFEYFDTDLSKKEDDAELWSEIDIVRGLLNGIKTIDKDKAKEYVKVLKNIIKEIEEKSSN